MRSGGHLGVGSDAGPDNGYNDTPGVSWQDNVWKVMTDVIGVSAHLVVTGTEVYPEQCPGPLLMALVMRSGMLAGGGRQRTTAVLPLRGMGRYLEMMASGTMGCDAGDRRLRRSE